MKITAYAWATGLIEFGEKCPSGALPIATGEEEQVRQVVNALARHGHQNQLLVPGIPESDDELNSVDILTSFHRRVREQLHQEAA